MPLPLRLDERSPAPHLSPGVVTDSEYLIRELCDPGLFDENGNVVEAAISAKDLLSRGFSVHRRKHTPISFVKEAVKRRCEGRPDWKECVALFETRGVRSIRDIKKQAFFVIDTPSEEDRGHASIYVGFPEKEDVQRGRGHARRMRMRLLPFLQHRMSVDDAYQSGRS